VTPVLVVLAALALLATACGDDAPQTGAMEVAAPFVPEPAADVGALYFTVENSTGRADALVAVETPMAEHAEFHETRTEGGQVTMAGGERVDLPEGEAVTFEPGGRHVMLVDVDPVRHGQQVQVTFRFRHAAPVTLAVPIAPLGATTAP
jgi:hypothetical protein